MVMALNYWHADFSFIPISVLSQSPNSCQQAALSRLKAAFLAFGSSGETFKVPQSGRRSTSLITMLADHSDVVTWEGLTCGNGYLRGFHGAPDGMAVQQKLCPIWIEQKSSDLIGPWMQTGSNCLVERSGIPILFSQMNCGLPIKNQIPCYALNVSPM